MPKKGEIKKYKYYSDNFKERDPHAEKIKKENRIKKAKEKAKTIEKNRQKITFKKVEENKQKLNEIEMDNFNELNGFIKGLEFGKGNNNINNINDNNLELKIGVRQSDASIKNNRNQKK